MEQKLELATGKTHNVPEWVFKALAALGFAKHVHESVPEAFFELYGYWFRGIFYAYERHPRRGAGRGRG